MSNITPTPQTPQPGGTVPLRDHLVAAEASEQDYRRLMAEHRARREKARRPVPEEAAQQTAPYEIATVRTRTRRRRLY